MRRAVHQDDVGDRMTKAIVCGRLGPKLQEQLGRVIAVGAADAGGLNGRSAKRTVLDGLDCSLDLSRNRCRATEDDYPFDAVYGTVEDSRGTSRQGGSGRGAVGQRVHEEDRMLALEGETRNGDCVREVAARGQEHRRLGSTGRRRGSTEVHQGPNIGSDGVSSRDAICTRVSGHLIPEVCQLRGHVCTDGGSTADEVNSVERCSGRVDLAYGQRSRPLEGVRVGEDNRTGHSTSKGSSRQAVCVTRAAHQDGGGRRTCV